MKPYHRTVLLLEKNSRPNRTIRKTLESAGYRVLKAVNGLRLVSRLHVDRPDVVVLDTSHAWTDCFDLCLSLKRSERFRNVRVVVLTDKEEPERANVAGCDRLIVRSSSEEKLLLALDELLQKQCSIA